MEHMALTALKPRLTADSLSRTPVLQAKAGTVTRQRSRAWMATRQRVALAHGFKCAGCGCTWVSSRDHIDHIVELADVESYLNEDDSLLKGETTKCSFCSAL